MKYAHVDKNNKLLGWYDKEIHDVIPTPNIEVTDDIWQAAIEINSNFYDKNSKEFKNKDFSTNKERELKRVSDIKRKASNLISAKYPDFKQLNIIRVGGSELENMNSYIDKIREISNSAEKNKTAANDIKWDVL